MQEAVYWLITAVIVIIFLYLFMMEPQKPSTKQQETWTGVRFAHRGLHDDVLPENSMAAFLAAAEHGYAIELDVHITRDGEIVVFHDDSLRRMCGVDRNISDCTMEELSEYRLAGTEHGIPRFEDVLIALGGGTKLLVELKKDPNSTQLCEKTDALLKKYPCTYCIESFDPRIVRWFMKHTRNTTRGFLADARENYKGSASRLAAFALSSMLTNFLCRPHFIAYGAGKDTLGLRLACALGAMRASWTIRSREELHERAGVSDMIIFENFLPQ